MYYNMTAFHWEQIVTGNTIYNFYRSNQSCTAWTFPFQIVESYFDNVTYAGLVGQGTDPIWIGELDTMSVFGQIETFVIATDPETGYLIKYISANSVWSQGLPGSEIMNLRNLSVTPPNPSLFEVPSFCP